MPGSPESNKRRRSHGSKKETDAGHAATVQGRRQCQEDASLCLRLPGHMSAEYRLACVADGHGGASVAAHCVEQLPRLCAEKLQHLALPGPNEQDSTLQSTAAPTADAAEPCTCRPVDDPVAKLLHDCFLEVDASLAPTEEGGSTAVAALIGPYHIWVANCGDSRAVLARAGQPAVALSDDHKPDRADEAERIRAAGGMLLYNSGHRVMGVLGMTRALGDLYLRQYGVIPDPEVVRVARTPADQFLLLASDGLSCVITNQEATTVAQACIDRALRKGTSRDAALRIAAHVLVKAALQQGSTDNVTVVLVDLQQPAGEQVTDQVEPVPADVVAQAPRHLAVVQQELLFNRQPGSPSKRLHRVSQGAESQNVEGESSSLKRQGSVSCPSLITMLQAAPEADTGVQQSGTESPAAVGSRPRSFVRHLSLSAMHEQQGPAMRGALELPRLRSCSLPRDVCTGTATTAAAAVAATCAVSGPVAVKAAPLSRLASLCLSASGPGNAKGVETAAGTELEMPCTCSSYSEQQASLPGDSSYVPRLGHTVTTTLLPAKSSRFVPEPAAAAVTTGCCLDDEACAMCGVRVLPVAGSAPSDDADATDGWLSGCPRLDRAIEQLQVELVGA